MATAAAAAELRPVDPSVWRAAAGTSVVVPTVNSRVYYFPQGHSEQSSLPPPLSPPLPPVIPCRVAAVLFLANPDTDEVFAKITLQPYPRADVAPPPADVEVAENQAVVSFAKVLTPSDANNGGGFSVPRFCADSIFPALDFTADPPVQNIQVADVHGATWQFRHIYRGTPRRHLLTTGWSKFVNSKRLVAGDSVVFMRNIHSGELCVGIRRAARWGGGRVTGESVGEAWGMVGKGVEFEVVYYPRVGMGGDFMVAAEVVEEAVRDYWAVGMKVKMAMETEDSSRMTWFQGTVTEAVVPDSGPWKGSPWKMLQVAWDEPEYLQHLQRVSPWQVEHVMPPSPPYSLLHPTKKPKFTKIPGWQADEMQDIPFPIMGLNNNNNNNNNNHNNTLMGNFNPSAMSYYSSPAGMQGARQSRFLYSSLSNLIDDNPIFSLNNNSVENMSPKLKSVSTELNIQSSQSEILSPDSQSNFYLFGTDIVNKQSSVSSKKAGLSSFQLFGKTIHVNPSPENNSDDTVSAEGNDVTMIEEAESVKKSFGNSFAVTERNLIDGLDYQMQKSAPAVEAFPFVN